MTHHLTLQVLLLLLPLAACHAGAEKRYVNEVESAQSFRMPRSASFSLQRSQVGVLRPTPVITEIKVTHSSQDLPSVNEGSEVKADITKRNSIGSTARIISQSNGHRKDVVKNALDDSSTSHPANVQRRRRRNKRPGVFLLPTALYSGGGTSSSSSRVRGSNFESSSISRSHSSVSSSQHSSTSFSTSSVEEGLSTSSTSERLNRTFAAALMKRQYHRFRALLPGGGEEEVDNGKDVNWDDKGEASNQGKSVLGRVSAEPSTQHISRTSLSRTVALADNLKQQRSAGEGAGALQSGKLPEEWQPFLPSDLLIPTGRGIFGDQSPEQLDSNSTGSVDSITRLLDERLGPGASSNYDPSILVDFLALIALTRPQQQSSARSAVRGEQIAAVLTSGRRRGGDIASRLSQRRVNLLPVTPLRHNLPPFEQILSPEKATNFKHGRTNGSPGSNRSDISTAPQQSLAGDGGCGGDADDQTFCSQLKANQADLSRLLEVDTEEVTPPKPQTIEEQLHFDADLALDAQKRDETQALANQDLLIAKTNAAASLELTDNTNTAEAKTRAGEPMEVTRFGSRVPVPAQAPEGEVLGGSGVAVVDQTGSGFTPVFEEPKDASIQESNASPTLINQGPKEESVIDRATPRPEASLLFSDLEKILQRNAVPTSPPVGLAEAGLGKEGGPVHVRTVQPSHGDWESRDLQQAGEFGPHSDGNDPDAGLPPPALPPVLRASLYSYLVPRLMALAPLTETIPGVPGLDYPIMSTLPYTNFYCINMPWPGFYADTEARCQAWHLCDLDGRQASFLCPNGTIFNQAFMVCDWWYNSDCQAAPYLYPLNERLFQQPELPPPTQQHRTLTAQVLDTLFL